MDGSYEIIHEREHPFKAADPKAKRKVCVHCGRGRHHRSLVHHGAPPSLNVGGSGWNPMAFQGIKQSWQARIVALLEETGMPRALESVAVQALICFPDRTVRDQGNFLFFLHKTVGDALVDGGWLVPSRPGAHDDDCFYPVCRYDFGGLDATYEKGRSYTRVMFFPQLVSEPEGSLFGDSAVMVSGVSDPLVKEN